MRILFIGDIFGSIGIEYLKANLARIKKEEKINLVVANAENATGGKGLSLKDYNALKSLGISCFTMGNHTFSNREIFDYLNGSNVVVPANYSLDFPHGYYLINYNGQIICVISLMGRVFQNMALDCPFKTLDGILNNVKADYYIVDFHAEATSEKKALGMDFDGRVDAILGTHTHVQTSDAIKMPKGTLYITDVGMTGPANSVIGNDASQIIERFRTGVYKVSKEAKGDALFNAVVLDFNKVQGNSIKRLCYVDRKAD